MTGHNKMRMIKMECAYKVDPFADHRMDLFGRSVTNTLCFASSSWLLSHFSSLYGVLDKMKEFMIILGSLSFTSSSLIFLWNLILRLSVLSVMFRKPLGSAKVMYCLLSVIVFPINL